MSDLIIKIGDDALDLSQGQVIALTKKAAEIADFNKVLGDITSTIVVPKTARNRQILDNSDLIQSESEVPYRRPAATLIQEGYETLIGGLAYIDTISKGFEIQLAGGSIPFMDLIEGKSIQDLDLSSFDHTWDLATAIASRTNTEGYIYPVTAMRELVNTNNNFDIESQLPAVFIHTIWDAIAEGAGYTWDGDFLDTAFFKKLILIWSNGKPPVNSQSYADNSLFTVSKSTTQTVPNGNTDLVTFNVETLDPNNNFNLATETYTVPGTGRYKFRYTHRIGFPPASTIDPRLKIQLNGTTFVSTTQLTSAPIPIFSTTEETDFIELNVGDEIRLFCQSATGASGTTNIDQLTWSLIEIDQMLSPYGGYYEVAPNLPDISQTEFVKGIAKMFGLIFQSDPSEKKVSVRRFDEVVERIPFAVDWSDKLDLSRTPVIKPRADKYGQITNLKYKEDANPSSIDFLGDGIINVDDENLTAEVDLFTLPFAASPMQTALEDVQVPVMLVFDAGTFIESIEPRILILDSQDWANGINYQDSGGSSLVTTDLPFAYFDLSNKTEGLSFTHTLLDDHWQGVLATLDKYKEIECYLNLKINDLVNIDFFTPVYISYFSNYFFVRAIENYVKGKLTKCRLIRL